MNSIIKKPEELNDPDLTRDALFQGKLILYQPREGYRFSVDSPLLVWFACQTRQASRAVDLGAGCGAVGLGLLAAGHVRQAVAVEVQPRLAKISALNGVQNGLADRLEVVLCDVRDHRDHLPQGAFDLVVSNPPFWPSRSSRIPHNEERRLACCDILGGIEDWVASAAYLISPRRGRLCLVFPARRLDELIEALARHGLAGTRICFAHPTSESEAESVLIEARPGKPGRIAVQAPLVLKDGAGRDTARASEIFKGAFSTALGARPDRRAK